jgi:thiol-disulfide isomerase/thioredoxin
MKSPAKLILGAVVLSAVIALIAGIVSYWPKDADQNPAPQTAAESQPPLIGQARLEFTLPDLSGAQRALKEWDGKVLAVNFWATWCGPCKEEIPSFNALQKQYGPRGMQFIGVAMDDTDSVKTYLKSTAIEYPVLIGGDEEASKLAIRYGDDEGVVPYTAFIDRKGRIAFLQYGAISPDLARQIIESLL